MIDLYYWPTPNGHKITMFLEAAGLEYRIHPATSAPASSSSRSSSRSRPTTACRRLAIACPRMVANRFPSSSQVPWKRQHQNLDDFLHLRRWFDTIRVRPDTVRAYAQGEHYANRPTVTEEGKKILFGQIAASIRS